MTVKDLASASSLPLKGHPPARPQPSSAAEVLVKRRGPDAKTGIQGVVRDRSGAPLEDATVGLCLTKQWTRITNNTIQLYDLKKIVFKTDRDGRFLIPHQDDVYALVVMHKRGFALTRIDDLDANGEIVVQPWAEVKGTFRIGAGPAPDQTIVLTFRPRLVRPPERYQDVTSGKYKIWVRVDHPPTKENELDRFRQEIGLVSDHFTMPETTPDTRGKPLGLGSLTLAITKLPNDR